MGGGGNPPLRVNKQAKRGGEHVRVLVRARVTVHVGGMSVVTQNWQQSWALALESGLPWPSHPVDMRLIPFSCACPQCPTGAWEPTGTGWRGPARPGHGTVDV